MVKIPEEVATSESKWVTVTFFARIVHHNLADGSTKDVNQIVPILVGIDSKIDVPEIPIDSKVPVIYHPYNTFVNNDKI